jgi:integrase
VTRTRQHGAGSRRPVCSGDRRIPGLYERTLADGSSVYEVALRLGGKPRRHTLLARTKTDAVAELRALQVDYERGQKHRSPAVAVTVADVARDWVEHLGMRVGHRDTRRRYSTRTVELYRQRLTNWIVPELGHRFVGDLNVVDVRRLVDSISELAPSTATGIVNVLSGLCRYAVKSGVLERNPVRDLDRDDRPGVARLTEPRYLTRVELDALLGALSNTFMPVAAACAYAGLRVSEALGLRWCDVDFAAGTLTISGQLGSNGERVPPKTAASAATIPLLPALARELRDHRSRQASRDLRLAHSNVLVFTTSRGKPQSRRNALRAVHAAGDAVGLNGGDRDAVGLHDLRHSFVHLAFEAGVSLPQTSALARHANARVTAQVYGGITEHGREQAAAKLVQAGFGA